MTVTTNLMMMTWTRLLMKNMPPMPRMQMTPAVMTVPIIQPMTMMMNLMMIPTMMMMTPESQEWTPRMMMKPMVG
jgi:hypothetical protein